MCHFESYRKTFFTNIVEKIFLFKMAFSVFKNVETQESASDFTETYDRNSTSTPFGVNVENPSSLEVSAEIQIFSESTCQTTYVQLLFDRFLQHFSY